jgi:DNA-directed RNA polymerase subunit N (RpoN/RPB10)
MLNKKCYSCNARLDHWEAFVAHVNEYEDWSGFWKKYGITRYCCMRMYACHYDTSRMYCKYDPADAILAQKAVCERYMAATASTKTSASSSAMPDIVMLAAHHEQIADERHMVDEE